MSNKDIFSTMEYHCIKQFYGESRARRSGVPMIQHINEGVIIMDYIGASWNAMRAFVFHPVVQNDEALVGYMTPGGQFPFVDSSTLILAMEYRNQANKWLSDKVQKISHIGAPPEFQLVGMPEPGPLPEVKDMLIADKVQNRRDFERYHKHTHPRAEELSLYFETWLQVLGVSPARYTELMDVIDSKIVWNNDGLM